MSNPNKIGRTATQVFNEDHPVLGKVTIVVYHNTPVVKFNGDKIILDSGGYKTLTTKTRMNQAANQFGLGFFVFQKGYDWYVDYQGTRLTEWSYPDE